jgi:hypothetical protein
MVSFLQPHGISRFRRLIQCGVDTLGPHCLSQATRISVRVLGIYLKA